jgi:hypothetical protein
MPHQFDQQIAHHFGLTATQPFVDIGGSSTLNLHPGSSLPIPYRQ